MANLLHSKGSRTQIYKTLPSNNVGNDGDIILSQIQGRGVYLCSKVNGRWHVSSKMEELRKIENTSTKNLTTNKLRVLDNLAIGRGTTTITKDEAKFTSSLKIKEASNAISDTVEYGQLWVKTATPNELYFTTDAGNDIQLTSGTTAAFVGDITSVVAGDGLTGGGTTGDVTLTVSVDDSTIETNSDALRIKDDGVTYSKIQNVTATNRILGRDSAGAGVIEEITPANLRTMINVADGAEANVSGNSGNSAIYDNSGTPTLKTGITQGEMQSAIGGVYTDTQLTDEQVQDKVGAMFNGNTETLITATYQDGDGTVDLVVDNDLSNYDNSSSGFITATLTTEQVQDIVGAMFSSNTETRISATYQDGDGTIDLAVDDMTADTNTNQLTTFTVSATTDSNATTISQGDDLMFAAGTGITCETTADGTVTITNTVTNTDTQLSTEQVQDIVGAMFTSNTETNTAVTYQDGDGTIDVVTTLDGAPLTTEAVQDIVGAMFTSNTETRVAATYQDGDGTIDLVVDDMTADTNTTYTGGTNLTLAGTTFNVDDAFLKNDTDDTMAGTLTIDKNSTATTNGITHGLKVDYDHTGISASGQNIENYGIESKINTDSPTHVGAVYNFGYKSHLIAGTSGVQKNYGYYGVVTGGDQNFGMLLDVVNGGIDYRARSSANISDHFSMHTTTNGATTLETVDGDAALAHLTLDADGDITLDAASGNIYVKNNGGNYTPGSDYEIATKKYVDDNAGGGGGSNFVTDDADDTMAGTLTIDKDSTGTTTATTKALVIDFDQTGISASGQTVTSQGLAISVNDNSVTHVGTHNVTGITNHVVSNNSGTSTATGIVNFLTHPGGDVADTSIGIQQTVPDGGIDIKLQSSADFGDYFSIATTTHGATTITTVDDNATAAHLTLDIDGNIEFNADGGTIEFKDNTDSYGKINSVGLILNDGADNSQGVYFNGASDVDKIYGDGDDIAIAKDDTDIILFKDDNIQSDVTLKIREGASAIADSTAYGQIWVKDDTPNNLYFTNDAGNDVQITNGSSLAGGSGGTQCWTATLGGFSPNNSATNYYTQSYPNYYYWSNTDSSPSSISYLDSYAYAYKAPKDGTLTKICFTGRCTRTDPFKIYVYKYAWSTGDTSESGTLIGTSATITPPATNQAISSETTISSSNTFSAGDTLYVWVKKDSTSGSQNMYMAITIQGEYS